MEVFYQMYQLLKDTKPFHHSLPAANTHVFCQTQQFKSCHGTYGFEFEVNTHLQ
jgi:hypothetical protein